MPSEGQIVASQQQKREHAVEGSGKEIHVCQVIHRQVEEG